MERDDYINVQEALKRIGGNMDLYVRLLDKFKNGSYLNPLEDALNDGAMEQAAHLAHTIKGVASNLSLNKLTESAATLEHKLKEGLEHSDEFTALKQIYSETSSYIEEIR